ncbi:TB10B-like protein [Mya arenaria]|uniref:TB10B-like protein n=1 Tax=Mya arenaria TaxID=6604 RepID=A0ABY7E481_MYAAR|nr:TBC1 domain family member 10A-like [Mya arenaria]WAR03786.1 TB10B-like protein [Mya arenaria]
MAKAISSRPGESEHESDLYADKSDDSEDDINISHSKLNGPAYSEHNQKKDNHKKSSPVGVKSVDNVVENVQNGSAVAKVDRYGFIGGKEFTNPDEERRLPIEVLRKRELKWLDMFQNWEKWMSKRFKKVKERCRKGIPPSIRSRAWQYLCGSKYLMEHNPGKFDEYLQAPGDHKCIDDIKKDLHRQFPLHEMFMARGGYGQEDLFRLLKAYTVHNPADGYCQAQAPIAAVLLMHMPAEEAFWCFVSICEKYLPGYYSPGLEAVQVDGDVLFGLLKRSNPPIYKHLKKHKVEPILYMTEWFMCVYSRTLPWASVLRVWDMFLCEGVKVVFRVGMVLVRLSLGSQEHLTSSPGMYETLEKIRHLPADIDESFIVRESLRLNISERDMEREHQKQIQRRKLAKEKPRKDSGKSKKKS